MHRMGKVLCEGPFVSHRQQREKYKQNVDVVPPFGKISADANGKGAWGPFHKSAMTDERLTNLATISIASETAKTLDMTELTKTFALLKTWKNSFS